MSNFLKKLSAFEKGTLQIKYHLYFHYQLSEIRCHDKKTQLVKHENFTLCGMIIRVYFALIPTDLFFGPCFTLRAGIKSTKVSFRGDKIF